MAKKDKKHDPSADGVQPEITESVPEAAEAAKEAPAAAPEGEKAKAEEISYTLSAEEFEKVQAHIAELTKSRDEAVGLLQRNQADFDNYRKRNVSARAESFEEGRRAVVKDLLPLVDNFDRAMEADASSAGAWADGVRLVYRQLGEILSKLGVTEIEAAGAFDPNFHNAVMSEKIEGKESGEILLVLQKGYRMGDTIIRHSMVKVSE